MSQVRRERRVAPAAVNNAGHNRRRKTNAGVRRCWRPLALTRTRTRIRDTAAQQHPAFCRSTARRPSRLAPGSLHLVCRNDAERWWDGRQRVWSGATIQQTQPQLHSKPELDRSEISGRYCLEVTTVHHGPFQEGGPAFVSIPADWSIEGAVWVAEDHFHPVR